MTGSLSTPTSLHHRLARTTTTTTATTTKIAATAATPGITSSTPPSVILSASAPGSGAATASESHSRSAASVSASSSSNNSPRNSSSYSPRVVFGPGAVARLPTELGRLCASSPLIVSSPSRISLARRVQALIPNLDSRILDSALVNVPQRVVDDAVARISGRDCVISVGGGSAVKLAKAIGIRKKIPYICIPTTYSGSEMPLLGDQRRRKDRRHRSDSGSPSSRRSSTDMDSNAMPTIVIYDEDLTSTSASMTISVPEDSRPPPKSRSNRAADDDAQWSYIHLPGV